MRERSAPEKPFPTVDTSMNKSMARIINCSGKSALLKDGLGLNNPMFRSSAQSSTIYAGVDFRDGECLLPSNRESGILLWGRTASLENEVERIESLRLYCLKSSPFPEKDAEVEINSGVKRPRESFVLLAVTSESTALRDVTAQDDVASSEFHCDVEAPRF